ncbi:MAG: Gfo/Idh/MocA family oxidoreductase [Maribacter sp.]|uniref:Gfo/Idh/MocA family protein n=1 Tax=Maribacter sp. TaxID=1897614 RepID=UPI00329A38A3
MKNTWLFLVLVLQTALSSSQTNEIKKTPLKLAVVGMTHGHVHQVLGRGKSADDIEIVGFVEANRDLAERLTKQYGYSSDLIYPTLNEMISAVKPEAVAAFNSTFEHLETVRYCAPKGVHIMVEKPLAVNWEHAKEMVALAKKHKVQLLTNYETSWYGSNEKAYELIHSKQKIGPIKRMVFHTGHQGPIEIGCNIEFLEWLTDPVLNGGGALTDFGCYGANLSTWLMRGESPKSITCITQNLKPKKYPKVDDDATIVVKYEKSEVIIQASWNWPHNVKDMEVYGTTGYVFCKNKSDLVLLENGKKKPIDLTAKPLPKGLNDPFSILKKVVHDGYSLEAFDVTSLENNSLVIQILDAAKRSAEQGKTILWSELYPIAE